MKMFFFNSNKMKSRHVSKQFRDSIRLSEIEQMVQLEKEICVWANLVSKLIFQAKFS